MVAEAQQPKANASAIEKQETLQQNEIAQQTGNTESVAAKQARAARSQSIVAAGAAGINLGSNSFLASLQTSTMNQSQQEQLMNESERNSERGSAAQADSEFAKTAGPSVFGAALSTALSGASAYEGAKLTEQAGAKSVPSDKLVPAAYYGGMRDALIGDM